MAEENLSPQVELSDEQLQEQLDALIAEQGRRNITKHPLAWASLAKTRQKNLCFAAAYYGWDHRAQDLEEVTRAEYDQQLAASDGVLKDILTANPSADVLVAGGSLHAVIVKPPTGAELRSLFNQMNQLAQAKKEDLAVEQLQHFFATRIIWPTQGSVQMARLLDRLPGLFYNKYPAEYRVLIGLDDAGVRKKG